MLNLHPLSFFLLFFMKVDLLGSSPSFPFRREGVKVDKKTPSLDLVIISNFFPLCSTDWFVPLQVNPADNVTLRPTLPWFLRLEDLVTPLSSWSLRRTILSLELLHSQFTWKTLKNFNPHTSYFQSVRRDIWVDTPIYCNVCFWEIGNWQSFCAVSSLCPKYVLCPIPLF